MGCVKEMIDAIPEEFWNRESIKILDPCAGNGNYPAYLALKTSLNNIYCNEISPIRYANLYNYFENTEIHLMSQDFFSFPDNEEYDLIIANPPYAKFTAQGTRAAKNHTLSREFLQKAVKMVKENGYLVFILPDNWMSYADRNNLPELLSQYKILTLNIGEAKKWFPGVGSSFTYFVIQKTPNDGSETKIISSTGITYAPIDVGVPCIPLKYNAIIRNLFKKVVFNDGEKYKVQTSSNLHRTTKKELLSAERDDAHPYRVIHTPNQTVWSERPHIYQDGWKVFLPTTTYFHPYVDNDCGMTQSIAFILCDSKEEAERICKEISNPLYKTIVDLTRYGNFNNQRILQHLSLLTNVSLTEEEENFVNTYPYH
jgi:SAM-dependent methyltransferase